MAKNSTPRSGPSRIRFIMVEADLQDGDLEQVTQVLQNAFKTAHTIPARPQLTRPNLKAAPLQIDEDEDGLVDIESEDHADQDAVPVRAKTARKPKPAKVPIVLNEIDVKSEPSLKDFVAEYELKTTVDRYLVIALWFRDARSINEITVDHVYTCHKLLGWPTASNDFSKPLSNLRYEQNLAGEGKLYSLTLTGAGKIEAKKRGSA
jgi:hypothetical protein